jgi:hypothetical protein
METGPKSGGLRLLINNQTMLNRPRTQGNVGYCIPYSVHYNFAKVSNYSAQISVTNMDTNREINLLGHQRFGGAKLGPLTELSFTLAVHAAPHKLQPSCSIASQALDYCHPELQRKPLCPQHDRSRTGGLKLLRPHHSALKRIQHSISGPPHRIERDNETMASAGLLQTSLIWVSYGVAVALVLFVAIITTITWRTSNPSSFMPIAVLGSSYWLSQDSLCAPELLPIARSVKH